MTHTLHAIYDREYTTTDTRIRYNKLAGVLARVETEGDTKRVSRVVGVTSLYRNNNLTELFVKILY